MTRIFMILLTLTLAAAPAAAAPGVGQVGSQAADWTLEALGGGTHTLSDHRGRVVFFFVVGWG